MGGIPTDAAVAVGVGVLLVAMGALIKYRGWTFLIAGYDATSSVPPAVARSLVGNTVLRVGLATIVLGALIAVDLTTDIVGAVFVGAVVLALGRVLYRMQTYTSPTE